MMRLSRQVFNNVRLKVLFLTALIFGMWANGTNAQAQQKLYHELKKYTREHIIPVMSEQRRTLDTSLSEEEEERIKRLRWQFKEIVQLDDADIDLTSDDASADLIIYFGNNQALIEALLWEAWEIADDHSAIIESLLEPLRQEQKKWKKDIKKIRQQYKRSGEAVNNNPISGDFKKIFTPAFFLLWTPEGLIFDYQQTGEFNKLDVQLLPNPLVGNKVELHIVVDQPGTYEVSFLGPKGTIEKTAIFNFSTSGSHHQPIDLSNLQAGAYRVRVYSNFATTLLRFKKN